MAVKIKELSDLPIEEILIWVVRGHDVYRVNLDDDQVRKLENIQIATVKRDEKKNPSKYTYFEVLYDGEEGDECDD